MLIGFLCVNNIRMGRTLDFSFIKLGKQIVLKAFPPDEQGGHQETDHSGQKIELERRIDPDCSQWRTLISMSTQEE